jgi:predicted AAA+ superfamily ATPase
MHRFALNYLGTWKSARRRKPLVIRGARQVGKSYLVREFARLEFENLVEINFERDPRAAALFDSKDPSVIVPLLEARFDAPVHPGATLLFLDEIQAAGGVLAALRYFHEELPALHVVAAGSLLEFALTDHAYSMPVGRIEYLHLGPMTFEEFLVASGKERSVALLEGWHPGEEFNDEIHHDLMRHLRRYCVVGGMPEAVAAFVDSSSYRESSAIAESIVATYRDDFAKYATRASTQRIEKVFARAPAMVGRKFKYATVDRDERSRDLGAAVDLLCKARVLYRVRHTSANGPPLGAEADDRSFKILFMDVGLMSRSLGLLAADLDTADDLMAVNAGALCEQFIGQHLLHAHPANEEPELYCWMREKRTSNAEVDYLLQLGARILPVEVKAGATGALRSLHVFLRERGSSFAVRFNGDRPSVLDGTTALADGRNRKFTLLSLPLYLVGQCMRVCEGMGDS